MFLSFFGFEVPVLTSLLFIIAVLLVTVAASRHVRGGRTGGVAR